MSSTPITPGAKAPGAFESMTRKPASSFIVGNVPAPSQLYIADDAFLRVSVRSVSAGVVLTVRTRMLRSEDGQITTSEDTIRPGSVGVQQFFNYNLTEGFLLSATITQDGGSQARGSVFVSMELCHGTNNNLHRDALLIQDYVATGYAASWPGGQIRLSTEGPGTVTLFQAGSPGAGNEEVMSFAANTRTLIKSLVVTFTTSITAGNRFPLWQILQGAAVIYSVGVAAPIPANTVATIVLAYGVGQPSVNNNVHLLPIPSNLMVLNLTQIQTTTAGILAGDTYGTASGLAEQWIDS